MIFDNIKKTGLSLIMATVVLSSCSEKVMDEINQNKNNPNDVAARFLIPQVITASAFSVTGSDYAFYASVYMESQAGVNGQMFNAEMRNSEPYSATTYNNSWNSTYTNLLNLKAVLTKCAVGGSEAGNFQTLGVAQILTAYNLAIQTDLMGDIPWTEFGSPGVIFQPKIDKQEAIYKEIMNFLDEAIVNLGKPTTFAPLGSNDLLYKGDSNSWIKFAYGLKARYKMRLSLKAPKYQEVIDDLNKSFTKADEQAAYKFNGTTSFNPFFRLNRDRQGVLASSKSLHDKLVARNDPRDAKYFAVNPSNGKKELEFAPNGSPVDILGRYGISGLLSATAPVHLFSFHELQFLKAEAYARLSNIPAAETALKTGIAAAFVKVGLTATAADTYYTASVKPLFDANPTKEIVLQKYLSFYEDEAVESYSDYRRLRAMGNKDFIPLANTSDFPLRFTYGNSDVTTNNNVKEAYGDGRYVNTENVWWAGGTR
ncbi:Susd and RagB outer membrane lipoprotein [Pedobacter steynii]|uniref:Susd and RagB outer membrane lipoprotein n=1 Tax=Pedobacter steynii TaxID=430522 RepID=A0A1H0EF46_9SPHI|nr:SusD/RagB family nutrient-binding outer membrane lipoprotein [Pedobacter steynii]NQX42002.1 SusD/RagB family nutrient-binding outer membrane lipoprotein [Pedobacter steynii]SDN81117.1 Susd and RagB outer membrane lipoprotein [Pedobacter steynii]